MAPHTKIQNIRIDGHKLTAIALNDQNTPGHPVVLIHGISASVRFWGDDQTSPFREQGPCYSLSLPGHYPAEFPPNFQKGALTAEMIGRVLAKAISELLGERKVTLVGVSTGGFAALAIALYAPELVGRIVCISGFCHGRWTGALGLYQWLARQGAIGRALFKMGYSLARSNRAIFTYLWQMPAADRKALRAYPYLDACVSATYPDFRRLDLDALAAYFEVMPDISICNRLSSIRAPTLVMAGDHDPIVQPDQARIIARSVPGASLAMIKGGGHLLFAERPKVYHRVLREWLDATNAE